MAGLHLHLANDYLGHVDSWIWLQRRGSCTCHSGIVVLDILGHAQKMAMNDQIGHDISHRPRVRFGGGVALSRCSGDLAMFEE